MNKGIILALAILFCFTSCNSEETKTTTTEERTETLQYEQEFVRYIIESNGEELALLQAGKDSCTDSELKANATQMLSDVQKTDNDFRAYAEKKSIPLEGVNMNKHFSFTPSKGNQRDIEWAEKVHARNMDLMKRSEEAYEKVAEPELKKMIKDNFQNIDTHRIMAEKLQEKLKAQPAHKEYPPLAE